MTKPEDYEPLMLSAEAADGAARTGYGPPFVVPNSMREVQPEINLLVSPVPQRLFVPEPPGGAGGTAFPRSTRHACAASSEGC